MLRELAGRAGRGSFSGVARRVVSDGIRCFERIDEALVSDTASDFGLWRTRSHGANTTNWSTGWQQRDGRLDRSVLVVDDWWKSQDSDVGRKDGKKGNRRAEAITETLAGASFDGLSLRLLMLLCFYRASTLALRTWQASLPPQSKPGWVREWASHRGRESDLSGPYYRRGVAGIARDVAPEA